jgi:hypothetical protein
MTTRQELYDRIRSSSKNEVILEEMMRLGFWPQDVDVPSGTSADIKRQGELERELRKLTFENNQLQNVEAIKKAQLKQRLEESRRKRQETKERTLLQRQKRAEAWKLRQQTDITYLGKGYSAGLNNKEPNQARLDAFGLGSLTSMQQLAQAMSISVGLLRHLAFGRKSSQTSHYHRFHIKKKTGGVRQICAPMPRLKNAQRWILDNILQPVALNEAAHGFRPARSIVTNAEPHVGANIVVNMDMEDFFPSVHYRRIKGVFRNFGFSESVAAVLTMLCSEPERTEVEIDGRTFFVARGERLLPQGAPTSPAITNLICRGLDARLTKIASQLGFTFTRYADDITFSSLDSSADAGRAIRRITHAVSDEGFTIHPGKTRVLRAGRRLEVTGLTVNKKVSVPRKQLRNFRAVLHQIERDGPAGKKWGSSDNVIASIYGYANFVAMVDAEKGRLLQEQVRAIIKKHGQGLFDFQQRTRWQEAVCAEPAEPPIAPTPKEAAPRPWWKFW